MGLRLRWTLVLAAASLALVGSFAAAIELARVQQVRKVQDSWESSRESAVRARLELVALELERITRELMQSGSLDEVVLAWNEASGQARRALADWAVVESEARGLDEILVLAPDDRVVTSARWPDGIGLPHPDAERLRESLVGAPLLWRSHDPRRPREDPWMIGSVAVRTIDGTRVLVATGRTLEGEPLQLLRADLDLDSLHFGPVRRARGEREFTLPAGWLPMSGAVLAWDPGAAPAVRALEGLRPWLGVAAVLALVMALVGAPWIASGLGGPLVEMATAVGAIGRGERALELPERGPREVRALRTALTALVRDLDAAEQQIRRAERRAAWREIARRIAHEIRNTLSPLALALDNVETVAGRDDATARDVLATSLATARDQLRSLQRLVAEFSEFARQPRPAIESFAVRDFVDSCVAGIEAAFPRVDLETDVAMAPARARGDVEQLRRALHNLLKNAVESSQGTPVELRVAQDGDGVTWWMEVRDRGPGVVPQVLERLGDPYLTTKSTGTGLGLPIVMSIVEAHQGHFALTNARGGGALARIRLPLEPVVVVEDAENGSLR